MSKKSPEYLQVYDAGYKARMRNSNAFRNGRRQGNADMKRRVKVALTGNLKNLGWLEDVLYEAGWTKTGETP